MKKFIRFFGIILVFIFVFCLLGNHFTSNPVNNEKNDPNLIVENLESSQFMKLSTTRSTTNSVTVKATVTPDTAANKNLTWNLAWSSESSEDISDYVTMDISINSLECTLTYLHPFSTQLILTASSVVNSEVKATCTVDCYKKTFNINFKCVIDIEDNPISDYSGNQEDGSVILPVEFTPQTLDDLNFDYSSFECELEKYGTIDSESKITYKIKLSDSLINIFEQANITGFNDEICEVDDYSSYFDYWFDQVERNETFYEALASTMFWFDIIIEISENDNPLSYSQIVPVQGFTLVGYEASGITLNQGSIIFK